MEWKRHYKFFEKQTQQFTQLSKKDLKDLGLEKEKTKSKPKPRKVRPKKIKEKNDSE